MWCLRDQPHEQLTPLIEGVKTYTVNSQFYITAFHLVTSEHLEACNAKGVVAPLEQSQRSHAGWHSAAPSSADVQGLLSTVLVKSRAGFALDLYPTGGQGASCLDGMMPVFVKRYRQQSSKPVPSIHAYFDNIQHSALFGVDHFQTNGQKP